MSVIAGAAIENDEDLMLDKKTWERVREIGIEDVYKHIEEKPEEEEMDDAERKYKFLTDGGTKMVDDDSDLSDDERKVKRMEEELAEQIRSNKEYKLLKTKRELKKETKAKALVELQRQKRVDVDEDERMMNDELMNQDQESSENDADLEQASDSEESGDFVNPLVTEEEKQASDDEWSSDGDRYDTRVKEPKERGSKKVIGVKRSKPGDADDLKGFFNDDIEVVPQKEIKRRKDDDLPEGYSSMDSDDIAETRALAKKMLRKKFREEVISNSLSHAIDNGEDDNTLPAWFLEDEAKHNIPNYNLTKEEVDEEKRQLREWNARPSKKVMEAKNRKKMRLQRALNKIKNKAQVIAN